MESRGAVSLVPRDFASGDTVGVLDVGPVRLGDVICLEVANGDLVRDVVTGGGRLIVVQTNNATFGRSGELVDDAPVFTREVLVHDVPVRDDRSLATRLGAAPEYALSAVGALGLLLGRRRGAA